MVNGRRHRLMPGSVFAYRPLTSHSIQSDRKDPLVKFFIDFSGVQALDIIGQKVFGQTGVALLNPCQPVHDLCEQMIEAGLKGGDFAKRICSALLKLLSLRIEENAGAPAEAHSRARQSFEKCRGELQKNFRTIRSIAELARVNNLTSAYLSRLFNRFSCEGPYEMLLRLKMNEAAAHLTGGHCTVKEVGAIINYPDAYHFSRVFKKCYGLSPDRFRNVQADRQLERIRETKSDRSEKVAT